MPPFPFFRRSRRAADAPAGGRATEPPRRSDLAMLAVMALALAGLLTGVGWQQSRAPEDAATQAASDAVLAQGALTTVFPALLVQLDEARGLEALHLLLPPGRERLDVEARLGQLRQRLQARLQSLAQRATLAATDREQLSQLQQRLAAWWQAQDAVLDASRRAARGPGGAVAAGQQATALLSGPSQQAWRQVLESVARWWQLHDPDPAASRAATQALAAAQGGPRPVTGLGLPALLLALLLQAVALAAGLMAWVAHRGGPRAAARGAPAEGHADGRAGGHATGRTDGQSPAHAPAGALHDEAFFRATPITPAHHAAAQALLESLVAAREPAPPGPDRGAPAGTGPAPGATADARPDAAPAPGDAPAPSPRGPVG